MKKSMRFLSFFLAIVLTISMGLPLRFSYAANSEESTTSYTSENPRFGILSVDLQDFKYYGFKKSDKVNYGSNYYKYGAGLKVEWALPADVKEGDAFTLTLPKEVYMDTIPNQSKVFFIIKDKDDQQDIIIHCAL